MKTNNKAYVPPGEARVYQMLKNAEQRDKKEQAIVEIEAAVRKAVAESDLIGSEVIQATIEEYKHPFGDELTNGNDFVIHLQIPVYFKKPKT